MTDFKIQRGPSSSFFSEPGVINPNLVVETGCWYLCTDTAELFLGICLSEGMSTLARINGTTTGIISEAINNLNNEAAIELSTINDPITGNTYIFTLAQGNLKLTEIKTSTTVENEDTKTTVNFLTNKDLLTIQAQIQEVENQTKDLAVKLQLVDDKIKIVDTLPKLTPEAFGQIYKCGRDLFIVSEKIII